MRIEFPVVCHMRCTEDMLAEIQDRGGSGWLRSLIAANTRPPAVAEFEAADEIPFGAPPKAGPITKIRTKKIKAGKRPKGRKKRGS